MHEHDFDLLAAIAEGTAAEDSEAALTGCPSCREELSMQREAMAALRAAPVPAMTDLERARLHRGVFESLAPVLSRPPATRRTPWYQRLVPVMATAAALLVMIGVGSVLTRGAGESAGPTSEIGSALSDSSESSSPGGADGDVRAEDRQALEMATTSASAAAETAAAAAAEAPTLLDFGTITSDELRERARSYLAEGTPPVTSDESLKPATQYSDLRCLETATERSAGAEPLRVALATVDGQAVEVYFLPDLAYVFPVSTCRLSVTID